MSRAGAVRKRALPPALVVIALCSALLVGCAPDAAEPPPAPAESTPPTFTSDEEALAAAETAYRNYQASLDEALSTLDDSNLDMAAAGEALDQARDSVERFERDGLRQTGFATYDSPRLSQFSGEELKAYFCLDLRDVAVVNGSGVNQVGPDAVRRYPIIASFRVDSSTVVLETEEVWDGENFCA